MIHLTTDALILGLGRSGMAAARLLLAEGRAVTAVDVGAPKGADALRELGATVICKCDALPEGTFDFAVVSPGVSIDSPWLQDLRKRGTRCISELELGWSRCKAKKTLAITGSLGKSTIATWCAEALRTAGKQVALAGNIGLPVCEVALAGDDFDVLVLEVSSFQCETLSEFRADVGILLNLFPNHLDRHADMDAYFAAKVAMFDRMRADDVAVLPLELGPAFDGLIKSKGACAHRYFAPSSNGDDWWYREGRVYEGTRPVADLSGTPFQNRVLGLNAAAAVAALDALGVSADAMESSAKGFQSLPHRMQIVRSQNGVVFVNDSKSTSLTSTMAAINMISGPLHLIVGGKAKETQFDSMAELLQKRGVRVYLIGSSAEAMQHAWADKIDCISSGTLQKAVTQCWSNAGVGHTILLSPGCASFDQFENFEDRGRQFCEAIDQIPAGSMSHASDQSQNHN